MTTGWEEDRDCIAVLLAADAHAADNTDDDVPDDIVPDDDVPG